jgi:hypothetical protein
MAGPGGLSPSVEHRHVARLAAAGVNAAYAGATREQADDDL